MITYNGALYAVKHLDRTTPEFRGALLEMCKRLNVDPTAVAAVMSFESGFNPAIKNPNNGATGLIQFTRETAEWLETTTSELAAMTAEQQIPYVEKYLVRQGIARAKDVLDVYMVVFWPRAIGKATDYVLLRRGDRGWEGNKSLDQTGDGIITKREAARFVVAIYDAAVRSGILMGGTVPTTPPNGTQVVVTDPQSVAGERTAVLGLGGFIGYMLVSLWKRLRKRGSE